tara:strand:+ start:473 stop:877 length:405 start_codon:yes stop_codon:yes gene_type:complete
VTILTLSIHCPQYECVPCIRKDPGPRKITTLAYNIEISVKPVKSFVLLSSLDRIQNIIKPVIIKPTLLKAFIGSRKILGLTLSHHREISPTDKLGSRVTIKPAFARMKYIKKNIMDADNAMKKEFVFLKKFIDT